MESIGYYGFLATRVAPQRLLATAARKAVRGAWQRLAPPAAPSTEALLDGLGCVDADDVAEAFAHARPCAPPWTPAALRAALERLAPGEVERAVARADAAASGRLTLFGREVDVALPGGATDWWLDPLHGGRFPSPAAAPGSAGTGLDPKGPWAIARGDAWVALACGAALGTDAAGAHAAALVRSVQDFVASNPVGRGVNWTCAMEAALRAWNLALALWLLRVPRGAVDPDLAVDAARLLVASARFVLAHLEDDTAVPNNHLVADWLGLLACAAALPEWPEAPRWRALAVAGLRRAIREQVNEDGTSFEGSVPYHRLATELFAAGAILAHAARIPLGADYARRLGGLFRAARGLLSSSGELPRIGDDDSGRVLALRERRSAEGGYLLPLGAALLRDPGVLVSRGAEGNAADAAEAAWLLGPRALAWLGRARPGSAPRTASFPQGGFHALRRGTLEVFVSCGANGQRGIGGHSHNDKLALELFVDGARAVVDPGSPTYTGDPELRNLFRSTRAHATVVVDGLEQAPLPEQRLFALPEAAGARVVALEAGGAAAERLVGEHAGFARVGVVHRRAIAVAERGALVVDRLLGDGTHAVELRWPLASAAARLRPPSPAERARLDALARALAARAPEPRSLCVDVRLEGGGGLLVAFALPRGLVPELVLGLRSPGYGRLVDAAVVLVAHPVPLPATLATFFLPLPSAEGA